MLFIKTNILFVAKFGCIFLWLMALHLYHKIENKKHCKKLGKQRLKFFFEIRNWTTLASTKCERE